jgi:chromosome segregation ATPase
MKINDILLESSPEGSNDYQQMMDMVRGSPMPGIPPEQRVALALFKELQKQKQHNAQLDSELDAAEQRIDQATSSGELQGKELGMHRGELERERTRGTQQKASIDQLGQTYARREEASQEQVKELGDKLEAVKSMPGVNKDSVEKLEKQIRELSQNGIGADKVQELERSIAAIQSAESTDDAAIKDLIQQVKAAQDATAELSKTKQTVGNDAEETAKRALDQIEQIKQQLAHFREVEQAVASLQPKVDKELVPKVNKLVQAQEFDNKIKAIRAAKAFKSAETHDQFRQTTAANAQDAMTMSDPAQSITPPPRQPVAESAFKRSIAWATGKKL